MANTVQIKRGNNTSVNAHTGPSGELIYNLDTGRLHAQDGSTAGGKPHALISDVDLKANAAVNIIAGDGLTGGGDLSASRTVNVGGGTGISVTADAVALNAASIASLGKADTALQAPGGTAGQILAKSSNTTNDVIWVSSEAATAVSYGPQTLNEAQKTQARANIGAQQSGTTLDALRAAAGAAANRLPYMTSASAAAFTPLTAFARSILDDANGLAMWDTMGGDTGSSGNMHWVKFPNGLIFQAGSVSSASHDYRLTFPTAFTAVCLYVGFTNTFATTSERFIGATTSGIDTNGADVRVRDIYNGGVVSGLINAPLVWFAIGW